MVKGNRLHIKEIQYSESRPAAAKWRVNSIKHYDLMVELWAADRATGSGVRTARQARRQRVGPHVSVDLNQNIEYIPEQSQWTGYRDPTPPSPPPSVDEYSPGQTQSVPSVPSGGTSSSRGSKRKAPMVDSIDTQFDKLTNSLDEFANVLSSSNVHFGVISDAAVRQVSAMEDRNEILRSQTKILRRTPNYTYTEADIYEMLIAMNISDDNLLEQCYDFLCRNPTCTKRLMGLPPHKRAWQHDLDDDEEEDQSHPHQNPMQPPPPLSNANMITQMWDGVQDLRHRMQGMEQMQVRVQRIEDNLANLSLDMNRQFTNLNQNVNSILHHLDD
ncbi:hypothetical protein LR48_Vigan543s001200 [Vigna angularis]|uniref:Uncharacterized protein n=1 Tax=Phaseolus angularis TaxID=3914 RepID=A0A0L9TE53_PHAAN|nr:hypothetical protein LR48_Vigan543s001200 [Vigna angularis]